MRPFALPRRIAFSLFLLPMALSCRDPEKGAGAKPEETGGGTDSSVDSGGGDTETGDTAEIIDTGGIPWTEEPCDIPLPSFLELWVHTSTDGLVWSLPTHVQGDTSVPEFFADPAIDGGTPWMMWMDFEDRSDRCDQMVFSPFDPVTSTATDIKKTTIAGAPPLTLLSAGYRHPIADPELIVIGGRVVVINTIWPDGERFPCMGVAVNREKGTMGKGVFDFQSQLLFCDAEGQQPQTDPVAIWVPDDPTDANSPGVIRVWACSPNGMMGNFVDNTEWIISVPDPTKPSTWATDRVQPSTLTSVHALGTILQVDQEGCKYAFWGTLQPWVSHLCTSDFKTWSLVGTPDPYTADPVVVKSNDVWYMYVTRDENYTGTAPH